MLANPRFNVRNLEDISNPDVQTFLTKLNAVVFNGLQAVGTDETFTDTFVDDLLRIAKLNKFPLMIRYGNQFFFVTCFDRSNVAFSKSRNQPPTKLYIQDVACVTSVPDFVIEKENRNIVVVEVCMLVDRLRNYYFRRLKQLF